MSSDPTLLDLLAMPSDNDFDVSQPEPGPSGAPSGDPSGSGPSGKSQVPKSAKRKVAKVTKSNAVDREEFTTLQQQMSRLAEAMEKLQDNVMASMAQQPSKKQKTDQTVSSSDESVSTNNVVEDLLKSSNDEASTDALSNIEQLYSTEDSGEKIQEKLAGLVSKMVRQQPSDDKITAKLKGLKRPANIEELQPTLVNPEVWNSLQSKTRSLDIRFQRVEGALMKSIVPIVSCISSLMNGKECDTKELITKLLDSVAIIGYSKYELNLRRRELIKPDLNRQFAGLCSVHSPVTGLLFGDNLTQLCKDIQETNKLGQKFGPSRSRYGAVGYRNDRGKSRQRQDGRSYHSRASQGRLNSSRPKTWQRKRWNNDRQPAAAK